MKSVDRTRRSAAWLWVIALLGVIGGVDLAHAAAAATQIDGARMTDPRVKGPPMAITHVTILPMSGQDVPERDMTVILEDAHIKAIGAFRTLKIPPGCKVVDGTGKFLLPSLADMHVHPENDRFLRLFSGMKGLPPGMTDTADVYLSYVANGVLQILNMAAMSEAVGQRADVESGRALGPHMGLAALVDGSPPVWPMGFSHPAATPEEGRQVVRDMNADGFDYIKTYSLLKLDTFTAVVDEARQLGMKTLGHIPGRTLGITAKFFQPNYTMVAHAEEFALQGTPSTPGTLCTPHGCTASDSDIPKFVAMAKRNGTWLESTLTLDDQLLREMKNPDWYKSQADLKYVNPYLLAIWVHIGSGHATEQQIERQQRVVDLSGKIVRAFAAAGIPVLPGTDTGLPGLVAGFALQDELDALVHAGLTPQQVLINDTRQAAAWLGVDKDRGTVEVGKRADLLLLGGNPLESIDNTRKIVAVISNGRYLGRADLDARMAALARKCAGARDEVKAMMAGKSVGGHYGLDSEDD